MDKDVQKAGGQGYGRTQWTMRNRVGEPARETLAAFRCDFRERRAVQIRSEAESVHHEGKTAKAIPIYGRSLRLHPTAEAHCYLGWAYSSHGRYDLAIAECRRAIEIDPDFGNSYNDIGSYCVSQGKLDEAVGWFERAKGAKRSDSPHYPYMNLGRVFAAQGFYLRAIREFERALAIEPGEASCLEAIREIRASFR